jgi:hypothetical protein
MANTFELISAVTVGSGGASAITFSSIPSTYTDLCVKYSLQVSTTNPNAVIRFNGLSTNIFSARTLTGTGSSVASSSYSSQSDAFGLTNISTFTSNTFSNVELYIPSYAGSNNKSFSIDETTENNATTSYARLGAWLWANTSAISSISITESFTQYSTAYLYGVKNA